VEVARINAYERNPRHSPNPEYDRIKASILVHGMDQLLQITRRPAQQDFIVRAGGNTRLQIVKELFAATGEERFGVVECQYLEWQGETDVLLAHLRENDLRGNLTFIDKARAVIDAKGLLAEEHGVDDIAYRELEGILRERGYSVTHAYLSLMSYAASTLLPAMPRALEAGLGKRQVQRIRKLERASRDIWRDHGVGNDAEFDDTFGALCRRYDGDDWVFEPLRQAIEVEIAEAAEADIQSVRMLIDWRLSGQAAEFPEIPEFEPFDEPAPPRTRPEARDKDNDAAASGSTASQSLDISIELPSADDPEALLRHLINVAAPSQSIAERRLLAHALARRLAERYGLGALIVSSGDDGLGYRVSDWPPASMLASLDAGMRTLVTAIWWQLVSFTDVVSVPAEHLSDESHVDARLSAALKRGVSASAEFPPSVHPAEFGYRLWRQLSAEDWRDWLCLAHNYRELHRAATARNVSLWNVGQ
ncbi:MAG: ParB family protein, partial [Woeseia sp.]